MTGPGDGCLLVIVEVLAGSSGKNLLTARVDPVTRRKKFSKARGKTEPSSPHETPSCPDGRVRLQLSWFDRES